ncbi:MAG TPA: ferrous iron transport protein A [Sphingobacterium sp.]|nr:ferrous iron transport protein A [Sphingobacterium sp.]
MRNRTSLDKLKKGEKAVIIDFDSHEIPAKFFELGFIPGTEVEVKHIAPLDGPICLNINDNALIAIRKSEAKVILIDQK